MKAAAIKAVLTGQPMQMTLLEYSRQRHQQANKLCDTLRLARKPAMRVTCKWVLAQAAAAASRASRKEAAAAAAAAEGKR
jgi:hypothetical protein